MDPSIVGEFGRATLELMEIYFSLVDQTIYFILIAYFTLLGNY
jgi:hypothetical protein